MLSSIFRVRCISYLNIYWHGNRHSFKVSKEVGKTGYNRFRRKG